MTVLNFLDFKENFGPYGCNFDFNVLNSFVFAAMQSICKLEINKFFLTKRKFSSEFKTFRVNAALDTL